MAKEDCVAKAFSDPYRRWSNVSFYRTYPINLDKKAKWRASLNTVKGRPRIILSYRDPCRWGCGMTRLNSLCGDLQSPYRKVRSLSLTQITPHESLPHAIIVERHHLKLRAWVRPWLPRIIRCAYFATGKLNSTIGKVKRQIKVERLIACHPFHQVRSNLAYPKDTIKSTFLRSDLVLLLQ